MIRLIWTLSAHTRYYQRRYMPTNRLLDAIRRRRNLKWGIPAMLLAVPYLLIASICTNALADGAPGWLHLVVLWSVWNAMKFIIMGPVSLVLLVRTRAEEAIARRHDRQATRECSEPHVYGTGPSWGRQRAQRFDGLGDGRVQRVN